MGIHIYHLPFSISRISYSKHFQECICGGLLQIENCTGMEPSNTRPRPALHLNPKLQISIVGGELL